MFRSATFKLTMYYLLIVAVISIGFSTLLYQVAINDLSYGLHRQTQRISDDFPVFSHSMYLYSGGELAAGKRHIIGRLVLCNIVVLSVAGLASYAFARRTLEPIKASHNRQKRFVGDVSHELRTPLTAITMESEVALLDTAATKGQLRNVIQSNIEETAKLNDLVSNLLRISQLENGQETIPLEVTSLDAALQAAITQISPLAQQRNITLTSTAVVELPILVHGDSSLLTQLFVILLDNAVKYSPVASKVTVATTVDGDLASITISDKGKGIAKHDLEHVFERFYRADESRSGGETNGFGLGLSIAKQIADSHNATIQLTSQPKTGTTAKVVLSVVNVKQPVDQAPSKTT